MTSQEMMRCKAKDGHWFTNIAKIDEPQNWVEQPVPHSQDGKIFGYDEKEFLKRQYK